MSGRDGGGRPPRVRSAPPIRFDRREGGGANVTASLAALVVVGAPVGPGFDAPRLTWRYARFPRGFGNVVVGGRFGFTEPDGTPEGRTPPAIRRACVLVVLRGLDALGGDAGFDARNRWRLVEERTRDQSYKLAGPRRTRLVYKTPGPRERTRTPTPAFA